MSDSTDGPSPALRRYQSECRRVGVIEAELSEILRARVEIFFKEHPDVRTRLERDYPDVDLGSVAHACNPAIALEVLATLPDGAGSRAYLDRLEALQKERGWSPL
jgi:hypothetical protein